MSPRLQFGHGGDAVENIDMRLQLTQPILLQFGHGGDAVENRSKPPSRRRPTKSFNSATAVMPWKTYVPARQAESINELQFGHGGDAVENLMLRSS